MSMDFIPAVQDAEGNWTPTTTLSFDQMERLGIDMNLANSNARFFCEALGVDLIDSGPIPIESIISLSSDLLAVTTAPYIEGIARRLHILAAVGKAHGATHMYAA